MNPTARTPSWPDSTVTILASGQSLTPEQCELVHSWRDAAPAVRKAIAINTTFRRAPWADMIYGCDATWWRCPDPHTGVPYVQEARATCDPGCEFWTQDPQAVREFGLNYIESRPLSGLSRRPGVIHQGGNGAYQAMNLAFLAGARRLVLLGVDMKGEHWHGPHVGLANPPKWIFTRWMEAFAELGGDLREEGVHVLNCSPGSALSAFDRAPLEEALR